MKPLLRLIRDVAPGLLRNGHFSLEPDQDPLHDTLELASTTALIRLWRHHGEWHVGVVPWAERNDGGRELSVYQFLCAREGRDVPLRNPRTMEETLLTLPSLLDTIHAACRSDEALEEFLKSDQELRHPPTERVRAGGQDE